MYGANSCLEAANTKEKPRAEHLLVEVRERVGVAYTELLQRECNRLGRAVLARQLHCGGKGVRIATRAPHLICSHFATDGDAVLIAVDAFEGLHIHAKKERNRGEVEFAPLVVFGGTVAHAVRRKGSYGKQIDVRNTTFQPPVIHLPYYRADHVVHGSDQGHG